jgi:hypothetical protein
MALALPPPGWSVLQFLDARSTTRAFDAGLREANPVMRPIAGQPVMLTMVKVAATGVAVWATEELWKTNRKAAIAYIVGANAAMAVVVARNRRAGNR